MIPEEIKSKIKSEIDAFIITTNQVVTVLDEENFLYFASYGYSLASEQLTAAEARIKELEDLVKSKSEVIEMISAQIELAQDQLDLIGAPKYSIRETPLTIWARIQGCTYNEPKDVQVNLPKINS